MLIKKESKLVKEGWVSDDSHHLWSDLGYYLAKELKCDVWLNDMGCMEASTDDWTVRIYITWAYDKGEVTIYSPTIMKSVSGGKCDTDRLGKENILSKIKDLLNLPNF